MKVLKMAKGEYFRWLFHSRMLLLVCMFVLIYTIVTKSLLEYADKMGTIINIIEPFIGVSNSPKLLCLVPVVFLVLISDFPRIDNNIIYKIFRAGRRKWVASQLIFLLLADMIFILLLIVGITLPIVNRGFLYNGWSDVITEMNQKLPELQDTFTSSLIPANLYYQMQPYKAFVLSILLLALHLYLLGMLIMVLKLLGYQVAGVALSGFLLAFGTGLTQFDLKGQWLFPAAHGLLKVHFTEYFRQMYCSVEHSVIYFVSFIFALAVLAIFYAKKLDYVNVLQVE